MFDIITLLSMFALAFLIGAIANNVRNDKE